MIRNFSYFYVIGPLLAACLASAGIMFDNMTLAYLVPAAINALLGVAAVWHFIWYKQRISFVILYTGTFLLFHFQLFSPAYWADFCAAISSYSVGAKLLGSVSANLLPIGGVWTMFLLDGLRPLKAMEINRGPEARCQYNEKLLFRMLLGLFILVAVPNVFFGGVFRSSINAILYMRSTIAQDGGIAIDPLLASLLNINHFACSLVILCLALGRGKFRWSMFIMAFASAIWAIASVFAMGSRTQVIQFGLFFLVAFGTSPKMKPKNLVVPGLVCMLIILLGQVMTNYRDVGLKEVNTGELIGKITEIHGLETLHDQTRAFEMYLEGYHNPASFGITPIDFAYGLVYRPIELVMYPLPRSFFPWKPVDPTLHDLNVWAITRMGINPDVSGEWGLTAGLLGRDALRWGTFGPLVALFWFSVLCWYMEREYVRDRWAFNQRLVAGAFAGTAMAMFRDLSPLWCLQLLPAAVMIMIARVPVSRSGQQPEPVHPKFPSKSASANPALRR
jgi:hypothetical protein